MSVFCPKGGTVRVSDSSAVAIPGLAGGNNILRIFSNNAGAIRIIFGDSSVNANTNDGIFVLSQTPDFFQVPPSVTHMCVVGLTSSSSSVTLTTGTMSA